MPLLRSLNTAPRLEVGARVYKGAPKDSGKLTDLDYFRVEFAPKFDYIANWFHERWPKPTCFEPIYLAGDTPEQVFDASREQWGASAGLIVRCNEVYQERYLDPQTQRYVNPEPDDAPRCQHTEFGGAGCECVKLARLRFVIPEAVAMAGKPFVFQLTTHSINEIVRINSILEFVNAQYDGIGGIPFALSRAPEQIHATFNGKDGTAKRAKITKSLVSLDLTRDGTHQVFGAPAEDAPELSPIGGQPELPAPVDDSEWLELQPLQIELNPVRSGYQYIIRCDGLDNPVVLFTGQAYRDAGFPVDDWKAQANGSRYTVKFDTPHTLIARLEGEGSKSKWVVREVR